MKMRVNIREAVQENHTLTHVTGEYRMKRLHVFVLFALFTMIALTPPASAQDDSTILPVDAVNATEILNEAGVAQALEASGIALTVGVKQKIAEHTISVPTPGYVLAMSTGTIGLVHMEGSDDIK